MRCARKRFRLWISAVLASLTCLFVLTGCTPRNEGIVGSGTIEATTITISARVAGELLEMAAHEGENVRAGELLARTDPADLEFLNAQARHAVALQEAQLGLLLAGAREEDLLQAHAAVEQAQQNLDLAERTLARATQLFEGGSTTSSDFDQAKTQFELARSRGAAARAALEKLQSFARPEEIRMAEAQLASARAAQQRVEEQLRHTTIVSPIDAVVLVRAHEPGEYVGPGTPLYRIADLSVVSLTVYLPGPAIASITLNQSADVTVDGLPDRVFTGRVAHISDEAEFTPKNVQTSEARSRLVYAVEISLENPEGVFKIGMPADAVLANGSR